MKFSKSLLSLVVLGTFIIHPAYAAKQPATMTSAEVGTLATVAAIDKNEILVAVVALNKKLNSDINDFANMMVEQHGGNLTQILSLINNAHPLTSAEADKLSAEGKKDLMKLGAMNGDDFAKAYVDAMVKGHEAALKLIDTELMKTATTDNVKKFLTDTRSAVATHLEHAKNLQDKLKS